jgi:hypothetical protein
MSQLAVNRKHQIDSRIAFATIAAVLAFAALPAQAQLDNEIAAARAYIQADRQDVVARNLGLTEAEATAFWPIYRDYRAAMSKVGDEYLQLIKAYAATWQDLTDVQASALLKDHLAAQQQEWKVKNGYLPKFLKVLPARKVARFYQIESKVDTLLRAEIAEQIPLVP